jgi:hypothetical protein
VQSRILAAILAGYFEPFAKRVWIHALLLLLPELVALPVAILTCKGHGCVASIVFLAVATPLHLFSSRCRMPRFSFGESEPQPPLEFAPEQRYLIEMGIPLTQVAPIDCGLPLAFPEVGWTIR